MVKNPPANAGDADSVPESGRSPEEGNSNPLQCSCLENPMDRGAWWAVVHGVTKELDTTEQLSTHILGNARTWKSKVTSIYKNKCNLVPEDLN